ncbi:MAG TPA: tetratricopeptide repeat protein [Candidatus Baltobacteraceae bacterium]|nr:tetratricopeptide repeat protein [Candidatus Baltobacteraceae bacterium]
MNPGLTLADIDNTVLDYNAVDTRVPFVGRAYELRALLAFLKRGGALTLVGPGGVGKSRLAHEAITRFARDSAAECIFLPLAGVAPEAVVGTVMSALGIPEESGRVQTATLVDRLRDRPIILALDNCEHAPDETSALIDALRVLPHFTVIATSQRRLDYTDETVFELEPFTIDDGIAFFLARAEMDSAQINDATVSTVTRIVERVDGLAVALDLAAARLASLSLDLLAEELEELRPYQLRSTRGSEPRHRTIGNVIAWSHSQLDDRAKRAFAQASLFADEFDEDDLCALGDMDRDDVRGALDDLVRSSLVVTTEFGYRMLLPIRAVATRMLVTARNRKALDEAFARRMNDLACDLWSQIRSGDNTAGAMARLQSRYADFCTTLIWAIKRPAERVAVIDDVLTAMVTIWTEGGRYTEGVRWTERLEGVAQRLRPEMRGRIYYLGLCVAHAASDYHRMLENGPLTISAFTIAGDRLGLARAYNALAAASLNTGRLDEATTYVETALRFYEQLGHQRGVATALINQGSVLFEGYGDVQRAHEIFRRAIRMLAEQGPSMLTGIALGDLAEVEYAMAEYDAAVEHAQEAIERFEASASSTMIAWQYETLARCSLARGYLTTANEQLLIACDLLRRSPQPFYTARLAEVATRRLLFGHNPRAAALAAAAARRSRSEHALVAFGIFAHETESDEAAIVEALGKGALAEGSRTVAGWDLGRLCSRLADLLGAE